MRKTLTAALVALAAAGLAACGAKQEPTDKTAAQTINLELDFYVNPDHAGIYTALHSGYFAAATWQSHTSPRSCSRASRASTSRLWRRSSRNR
jgi:ABC-type nitrate/sulfonate/bicarbonate transport system substrate-binding protein